MQIDFRAGVWEHYHYMFDKLGHNFEQAVSQGISLSRLTVTGLACNTPTKFLTQMAPLLQPGGRVALSFEPDYESILPRQEDEGSWDRSCYKAKEHETDLDGS